MSTKDETLDCEWQREVGGRGLSHSCRADDHRSFCFVFSFTIFYTRLNGNVTKPPLSVCSLLKKVLPVEFIYIKEHRTLLVLLVG